jgi:hypothetical protein
MLVFYEVQDLANAWIHDFEAPELGVALPVLSAPERRVPPSESLDVEPVEPGEPTPEQIESMTRTLEQAVRTFIEPQLTDITENVRATRSGTLVVNALPVQQEWVEGFLSNLRSFEDRVEIEATIYTTPRGTLPQRGYGPNTTLPRGSAGELKALAVIAGWEVVNAPKILMFPCQRAHIAVLNEISFVKSWQLQTVEPGAQVIADPEVASIQEGCTLEARVVPLPDQRFGVELRVSVCEIEKPIPTRKVRLGDANGQEAEIAEPQAKTARFETTVVLVDGGSVVLVTPDIDPEQDLAAVVTVRRVEGSRAARPK